ncbi:2,3-dihydroxybenzoate--AMP ligase [Paenibacillus tarimensis]
MNRHYREGFTRVHTNDLYDVERQLQEYDEHLYLMWNPHTGEHLIMDGLVELAVMRIPQPGFPELSSRVVGHIRSIHTANGFSASQVIQKADERREKESSRKVEDMAQDFAKESLPAFRNAFDYGITEGAKKYVQVSR